jgi:RNA polymerase sigma factor (sigma-70 family)
MIRDERRTALQCVRTLFEAGTLGGLTDGQLLEKFSTREGGTSEAAFAALVERHGSMVLRVSRSILFDSHAAEDAFQATFLVLAQKSKSLKVRDSLGPWLHQVAFRVASCARAAATRRRKHERRAAEMMAPSAFESPPEDFGPVLHKELAALPERYRAVVVLCCLEGLTHAQAARQLGCPIGTLQSRLARGRQRLQDRLARRGIAPSLLLGATASGDVAAAAVSQTLLDLTVRAAMRLGAGKACVDGMVSVEVATLLGEVTRGMLMSKLKLGSLTFVALFALAVVGYAFQAEGTAAPRLPESEAPASELLLQKEERPGPKLYPSRLDFGPLRLDAMGEASAHFFLEEGYEWGELAAKVIPPPFLKVKSLRIRERTQREKRGRLIELGLAIDTSRVGDLTGHVRFEYGDRRVELPVSARVLPKDAASTKVLVIAPEFGDAAEDPDYYRPWFELIEAANLDVSYLDPSHEGLRVETTSIDRAGMPVLPDWFKRYDVILMADGGPVYVGGHDALVLQSYVKGGGRLIVGASAFMAGSTPNANEVLKPFGLEMMERDITKGRSRDDKGWAPFTIEGECVRSDALTRGVESVVFRRATPVRVTEGGRGEILLQDPENAGQGFAAVSRDGGEVVALGPSLLFQWLGEKENEAGNASFLRNLLTRTQDR